MTVEYVVGLVRSEGELVDQFLALSRVLGGFIPRSASMCVAYGLLEVGVLSQIMTCNCARSTGAPNRVLSHSSPSSSTGSSSLPKGALPPLPGAPQILYTDVVSGPNSGGEQDQGIYLSIFGKNFGNTGLGATVQVFINDIEVANYRYLGNSRGRPDVQQITVQVGAIGYPRPGTSLPIKVVVNGLASNQNHTFTLQPGDIRFVSPLGDDATAVKNDITHPWRYVQTASGGGALASTKPGDVLVLRGGAGVTWSDIGYQNRWFRFRGVTGNEPTGERGRGYIAVIAYPGEDVHYVPPPNTSGGIHGLGDRYPEFSDWIVVSGLHVESAASALRDGAPINLQANSDHWRIVNNELGPWPASSTAGDRAGGIVGNGNKVAILGNHIHDIGGGHENHGIYLDSGSMDIEIAYNDIHDVADGNLIQTYDNLGNRPLERIAVHHNLIHSGGRYGLNIADGTHSYSAWNNVIYDTALAGVRFNVYADASSNFAILHNTICGTNTVSSNLNAPIANGWALNEGVAVVKHNIIATSARSQGTAYFADYADGRAIAFERNLWYGRGHGSPPPQDSNPVGNTDLSDPGFTDLAGHNFALTAQSPAIDQASAAIPFEIGDDYAMKARTSGASPDVGAYEF